MEEVTSAPLRARFSRLEVGIVGLAAAFAALTALVAAGMLDSVDRYAVVHWMPGLDPAKARDTVPPVEGVFLPFNLDESAWWHRSLDLVMYPASVLISIAVFALASRVLWRQGARIAAVVWAATWFVANALEVIVKFAIEKPALYFSKDGTTHHLASFDHSFPSGHALRAVLVAAIVLYVWKRFGAIAVAWALLVPVCLVAASWHVPSDVAGGVIFGLLFALGTHAAIAALVARRA